jgi:hypothetical protein
MGLNSYNVKRHSLIVLIIVSVIASLIIQLKRKEFNIGLTLGGAFVFLIVPYLISSLIKYGLKISSWNLNFEDKSFLKTFIVIWCIWVLLNAIGAT